MVELKNHLLFFMERYVFPQDAKETFLDAFDTIFKNQDTAKEFADILEEYNKNIHCSYQQMIENAIKIGEKLGIHSYTISLLLFIFLSKKLRENYVARGISEEIFDNSVNDLYYKLIECRLVYGINGTFVASWFSGFFNMTRFALGRLQFEIVETTVEATIDGTYFPVGSKAINVHIPRTGTKLSHEDVLNSYRLAAEMFADEFEKQPILFCCDSWILDPWLLTVLDSESNIVKFSKDYHTVKTMNCSKEYIIKVIFNQIYTDVVPVLPEDTSLHKAYANRIKSDEELHVALGMFVYKDGAIIN